jgi:hypothetical protein
MPSGVFLSRLCRIESPESPLILVAGDLAFDVATTDAIIANTIVSDTVSCSSLLRWSLARDILALHGCLWRGLGRR